MNSTTHSILVYDHVPNNKKGDVLSFMGNFNTREDAEQYIEEYAHLFKGKVFITEPEMSDIKFEVGKKYKYRDHEGWAELIAIVPRACAAYRLVFLCRNGLVVTRYGNGGFTSCVEATNDILPEEYVEPFKPHTGVWRMRNGGETEVLYFTSCNVCPISGDFSWTAQGWYDPTGKEHPNDLIEWLRPLPAERIVWMEEE